MKQVCELTVAGARVPPRPEAEIREQVAEEFLVIACHEDAFR